MHNKSNGRRIRPQLELGQIIQNLGSPTYWDTGSRVPIIPFFGRVDPCKIGDGFKNECVPLCLMHRGRNSTATQCRTRVCMFTDCLYFLACFFQPFFRSNWIFSSNWPPVSCQFSWDGLKLPTTSRSQSASLNNSSDVAETPAPYFRNDRLPKLRDDLRIRIWIWINLDWIVFRRFLDSSNLTVQPLS